MCNTRKRCPSVQKNVHHHVQICRTANFFVAQSTSITWLTYFPNLFLGQSPHENVTSVQHKWFATKFLPLNQPQSPGWLILQTFWANHPQENVTSATKTICSILGQSPHENVTSVQQKWLATSIFADFVGSPSPPITVDPFSVQSVRDYTKAWLTADRPSSSPRTSITVFPCLPTKTPLLTCIQGRWGEGRDRFSSTKILRHQFRIPSKPTAAMWSGSAWNFLL